MPVPLTVELPPAPPADQKREALRNALRRLLIPEERIDVIIEFLDVDGAGQVYITAEGIRRLQALLTTVEIPEHGATLSLPVFRALLLGGASSTGSGSGLGESALVFFGVPEAFIGKNVENLHVVKMLSTESAEVLTHVFDLDDLRDGTCAVVEIEQTAEGEKLKRVLEAKDSVTPMSRIAMALQDGGEYDLDAAENGGVTDPAFILEATLKEQVSSGGSGCSLGGEYAHLSAIALLLPALLLFLRK